MKIISHHPRYEVGVYLTYLVTITCRRERHKDTDQACKFESLQSSNGSEVFEPRELLVGIVEIDLCGVFQVSGLLFVFGFLLHDRMILP